MTDDYKDTLLDYITGTLDIGSQSNNSFRGNEEITNNLVESLNNLGISPGNYIQTLTTETTSNYLMYGGYISDGDLYGYIVILNQEGNIVKIITEYESGTKLGYFEKLEYDDSGNIYGIDTYNSKYRVILLNNVALETTSGFICRLRNSYYITDTDWEAPYSYLTGTSFIKKDPNNDSVYYILGQKSYYPSNSKLYLIRFTINVGSSNTWEYFEGAEIEDVGSLYAVDYILELSGDTTIANIRYTNSADRTKLEGAYFDGSALSSLTELDPSQYICDFRMVDSDTTYISTRVNNSGTYTMYLYKVDSGVFTILSQESVVIQIPNYYLNLMNGKLFGKISGYEDADDFVSICNVYDGENFIQSPTYTMTISNYIDTCCTVQKTYALYKFLVQGAIVLYRPSIVIYDSQYSGGSYVNYDSLVPLHSEIYSSNDIVFARSLYNKQVYQNTTISIVNVPNNFLNDISLTQSNLIGTSMMTLANDTNTITKNIYENLFINFNNKIQVTDEDTGTLYPGVATYINTGVSYATQQDYEGSKITKMRINYADETTSTRSISWTDSGTYKYYEYTLFIDKEITSIEFLNEDENYTYLTKTYDFELGKFYTLTQKIRVE